MPFKLFDPRRRRQGANRKNRRIRLGDRDRGKKLRYDYEDHTVLAVNVALATGRPLLVSGAPGTGKSSLAPAVAERLGWRFYRETISSRTQARDLLWRYDTIRRLSDARSLQELKPDAAYIEPGVMWWAFERDSALRRGLSEAAFAAADDVPEAPDPSAGVADEGAVVLLDEIDKADPDVPNNLLEPLGSFSFTVDDLVAIDDAIEGGVVAAERPPLILITTNDERDLPRAFLRRCVSLTLQVPDRDRLLAIAKLHFPRVSAELRETVADLFFAIRDQNLEEERQPPSLAEYLDALSACRELELRPGSDEWAARWNDIAETVLQKRRDLGGGED